MENFIEKLQDVMDCEQELFADTILADVEEWDSLSFVSFIAMASASYGKKVAAADVRSAKTVADLYELVK